MEKNSKKNKSRLQLVFAVMIMAALLLAELYVMINESGNIVLIIGIAVLILIALYFVIDAILDCIDEKNIANAEQYDNIYRSEKASYMLLKKSLESLSKQVDELKDNSKKDSGSAEIIKSQKSIAKVAMSKSKDTQDKLFIELNNIEASLNDSVRGISEKLSGFQEEIERLADHIAKINAEAIKEAAKSSKEITKTVVEEVPVTVETIIEESNLKESNVEELTSLNDILGESLFEELPVNTDMGESNELDFAGLDFDMSAPVESDEDILSQLLAVDEATPVEEVDVLEELTKAVDEIPAPTPAAAPADNGGKMNQDDIAALIASMTGGDAAPEPEPEPVPTPAAAPADNGGKMNQDDIAALIASMAGGDAAPEPEPEPVPTSAAAPADNGGKMNQDDIAALIASMTGG